MRTLLHVHRGVLHDVVDVRSAQQGHVAADDEFVQGAFGRRVQVEVGLSVDGRTILPGYVDYLEIRRPERDVGRHAAEIGQVGLAADRQRLAVRGEERVVVEYDAAVVDADRVGRQPERRADHRYADFGLCEVHAPVQPRPVSGASCVDFRLQPAGEADEVVGQEHVGLLQRESGDRRREVERAFALCAVIFPDGQYLGAVERQPRIGHMSLILLVIESEVDVAEAPFVVRQFRDGQVAAQGQAVGRHAQRHFRTQYAVDGRGGGQQP